MDIFADEDHLTGRHVLFHCSSQGALGLLAKSICLVDNQDLELFPTFHVYLLILSNFLHCMLDNVSIIIFVISWGDFNVEITTQQ